MYQTVLFPHQLLAVVEVEPVFLITKMRSTRSEEERWEGECLLQTLKPEEQQCQDFLELDMVVGHQEILLQLQEGGTDLDWQERRGRQELEDLEDIVVVVVV
jgi:hypothetical protein